MTLNSTCLCKINLNVHNIENNIRISIRQVQDNYKNIIHTQIQMYNCYYFEIHNTKYMETYLIV